MPKVPGSAEDSLPVVEILDGTSDTLGQKSCDLERLFAPLTTREFLETRYRRKQPVLFRGARDRFKFLLDWSDLNDLLASRAHIPEMTRLARDGEMMPVGTLFGPHRHPGRRQFAEYPPLDDVKLNTALREGTTLILKGVNFARPRIQSLVDRLEQATEGFGKANLYASWTPRNGFPVHWDSHDAFIVQIAGYKRWYFYGVTRPSPLDLDRSQPAPPPDEPIWDGLLAPGDLLFVPRGMWHDARTTQNDKLGHEAVGSLHLTLSIVPVTGQKMLQWLTAKLLRHELFRMDLPLEDDDALRAHFRELRTLILKTLDESPELEFERDQRACWSEPSGKMLDRSITPWTLGDAEWNRTQVRIRGAPRYAEIRPDSEAGHFSLVANGQTWRFDEHCLALLRFLIERPGATVKDAKVEFKADYSPQFVDDFVRMLIEEGAAAVLVPDTDPNTESGTKPIDEVS